MRFGNREKAVFIYIMGLVPLLICIYINSMVVFREGDRIPFWYSILIIFGAFITFMGLLWIISKISVSRVSPMIDDANPEEITAIRVTKDGVIIPLFAPKGSFGKIEVLAYGEDADFMDEAEFPLRTINGNPAIIVYDMLNTALDFKRSVARKYQKRHVENGVDGYKIWKRKKEDSGVNNAKKTTI